MRRQEERKGFDRKEVKRGGLAIKIKEGKGKRRTSTEKEKTGLERNGKERKGKP